MPKATLQRKEGEVTQQRTSDMHGSEVDTEPKRLNRGLLIGAAGVVLLLIGACQSSEDAPVADQGPGANEAQEKPVDAKAREVATGFLKAYGAFDAGQAITYLADDAAITELITSVGAQGVTGTLKEFRLLIAQLEGTGYKHMLDPCEELGSSASGTVLRCTFDFHLFRSDEIGRGPFSGSSFLLTVRDGEIVRASVSFGIQEFSPQMWEPFATWVSKTHPEDVAVMYEDDSQSGVRLTKESSRLWERYTRDYVEEVGR
jgi:hypothetical protein